MTQEYSIVHRTAEELGAKKKSTDMASLRVKVAPFPGKSGISELVMVPDYERGCLQVVCAESLPGSPPGERLRALEEALEVERDGESPERLRRLRAASEFRGKLSSQKLTIPAEVAWVLHRDNPDRELILVVLPDLLEIWPTRRWQNYLAAHLYGDARADIARDTL